MSKRITRRDFLKGAAAGAASLAALGMMGGTALAVRNSVRKFEATDLQL